MFIKIADRPHKSITQKNIAILDAYQARGNVYAQNGLLLDEWRKSILSSNSSEMDIDKEIERVQNNSDDILESIIDIEIRRVSA